MFLSSVRNLNCPGQPSFCAQAQQRARHGEGYWSKSIGASKTVKALDGSKAFPSKRPWMISH